MSYWQLHPSGVLTLAPDPSPPSPELPASNPWSAKELGLWFAGASLILNALLLVSSLRLTVYYVQHSVAQPMPLDLFPFAASSILSALLFAVMLALHPSPGKKRFFLLVLLALWLVPLPAVAPASMLIATLAVYWRHLALLADRTIRLFSIAFSAVLALSMASRALPGLAPFFYYSIGLNLAPLLAYPILTAALFIFSLLSLALLLLKRPTLPQSEGSSSHRLHYPLLAAILILSVLLSLIPYLPQVNPSGSMIGVDSADYLKYIEGVAPGAGNEAFLSFWGTDRPLTFLLLYALSSLIGAAPAVKVFPVLLSPLFALSIYLLARSLFKGGRAALIAAFFAATSFNLTAGFYSYILANWLSLCFAMLFFAFFVQCVERPSVKISAASLAMLILCYLSHSWTWVFVLLISVAYLASLAIIGRKPLKFLGSQRYSLTLLAVSILIDRLRALLNSQGGFEAWSSTALGVLQSGSVIDSFKNMVFSFQYYVGGFYSNLLVITLLLVGTYLVFKYLDQRNLLIICWLAVLAVPFFFINLDLMWRVLYLIPAPLVCGYALSLYRGRLLLVLTVLWQINYVIYCLTAIL